MNKLSLNELKNICREKGIKNYSKLNKSELMKYIKKNMRGGNLILTRELLLKILNISEDTLLLRETIALRYNQITRIDPNTFNELSNFAINIIFIKYK